jgi:glucosamine kinase
VQRMDGAAVGADHVADTLFAALEALGSLPAVESIGVGLSGFEAAGEADLRQLAELLRARIGAPRVTIASDGVTSLLGALGESLGAVVAGGTGTVCVARGPQRWAKVDGWGSLLGDDGSAFAIGRSGLNAGLRKLDGRGGSEALLAAAAQRFGEPAGIAEAVYRSPVPTRTVASFARDVAQVAADGDAAARSILEEAGRELAVTACAALARAFDPGEDAVVSYSGSVFATGSPLIDAFSDELARLRPDAKLMPPAGDALAGAALLAELGPTLTQDREMLWSGA